MRKEKFDIVGMTCSSCVSHVEKSVAKISGVKEVNVHLLTNSMTVEFDEKIATETIESAVASIGYQAVAVTTNATNSTNSTLSPDIVLVEQQHLKSRWLISVAFLIPLLYISMGYMIGFPLPYFFEGQENALIHVFTQFLWILLLLLAPQQRLFMVFLPFIKLLMRWEKLIILQYINIFTIFILSQVLQF